MAWSPLTLPRWRAIAERFYGHQIGFDIEKRSCYSEHRIYACADGKKFVLSRVRKNPRRPPFAAQFQLLARLHGERELRDLIRLPVPRVDARPEADDRLWVTRRAHFWFLREYREHNGHQWSADSPIEDAAVVLATIHGKAAVQDWADISFAPEKLDPYHWSVEDVVARFDDELAPKLRRLRLPGLDTSALCQYAARLHSWRPTPADLGAASLTHQDYRPENVLVTESGTIAEVIDWDRARHDYQIFDAMQGAAQFAMISGRLDWQIADRFLGAYFLGPRPTDDVLAWIKGFVAVKCLLVSRRPERWVPLYHQASAEPRARTTWAVTHSMMTPTRKTSSAVVAAAARSR